MNRARNPMARGLMANDLMHRASTSTGLSRWGEDSFREGLERLVASVDAEARLFPDARFWMTHRDPAAVVGLVADLYAELSGAYPNHIDRRALGEMTTRFCVLGMERMIAFRDAENDERFFDVDFAAFQRDPLEPIAALYHWLGEDLTGQSRAAMLAWRAASPRDKHGSHTCDPAEFDLDAAALRARFEQLFRATDTVEVDGQRREITGTGLRIHRRSKRELAGFWGYCRQSALFPDGRAFGYIAYGML